MQAALCQLHSFTDIRKVKEKGIGFTLQHLYISRKIRPIHLFLVRRISLGMSNLLQRSVQFSSVQSLSHVWLFATPWITACQASLSITNSRSSPKLLSIESVMPSSHLILCHPRLLLPPIPPSIRVFSKESFHLFAWGGQSTGVSALASFLPKKSQGWSP